MRCFLIIICFFAGLNICQAQGFVPGQSYFSTNDYIEYVAGNFPLVLSVPHGGYLNPTTIPDRNCDGCSYFRDTYTQELARQTVLAVYARTGCYPHLVINRLHRKKLDANREIIEAADSNLIAEAAWRAYHAYLDTANTQIRNQWGKGLYIDVHGHAHDIQRMELGYLLTKTELQASDSLLNTPNYVKESSIRNLVTTNLNGFTHAELLNGAYSLGTALEQHGYPAVPSETDLFPDSDEPYFNGGYNTARYGSRDGGTIDGVQIECNGEGVRDNLSNALRFADTLSVVVVHYLQKHYFGGNPSEWCTISNTSGFVPTPEVIDIFPNPGNGRFKIRDRASLTEQSIEIYDVQGQLIQKETLLPYETLEINIKSSTGILWLLLRQPNGAYRTIKIMIHGTKN